MLEFIKAALPWVVMGIVIAIFAAQNSNRKKSADKDKEAGKLYERGYVRGFVPRSLHSLGRCMGYGNRHLFRLMRGTSDRKSCKEAGLGHENYRNNMPMQAGA